MGSAQQSLFDYTDAYSTYKKVLEIDPKNKTALKKTKELELRTKYKPFSEAKNKGF